MREDRRERPVVLIPVVEDRLEEERSEERDHKRREDHADDAAAAVFLTLFIVHILPDRLPGLRDPVDGLHAFDLSQRAGEAEGEGLAGADLEDHLGVVLRAADAADAGTADERLDLLGEFILIDLDGTAADDDQVAVAAGGDDAAQHQDQADAEGRDQGELVVLRTDAEPLGDGPEDEDRVAAVFDRCAETHDGQGADHAERDHDVAADHQHDHHRDQQDHDQRLVEAPVVRDAPVRDPVGQVDEQRDHEAAGQREQQVPHPEIRIIRVKIVEDLFLRHVSVSPRGKICSVVLQ